MKFTFTREAAAELLNVSTRTVDRYIKSGKIAYKKIANKVLLSDSDIAQLQSEFGMLHQNPSSEIVSWNATTTASVSDHRHLEKVIDEKIDKFFLIFQEKDTMLEEKNKIIFMLQQRVGELENKIQTMIALPDHNEHKQIAAIEKTKLEDKIKQLSKDMRGERTKSTLFLTILIVGIVFGVLWYVIMSQGLLHK